MNLLSAEILQLRSEFLYEIRSFFVQSGFLEVDTPVLRTYPGMEPYLDPYKVSSPHNAMEGYLITSPEYSMKEILSTGTDRIYEIAHVFRSGENGKHHTGEFLMLEFYQPGDEQVLMETCISLFVKISEKFKSSGFKKENILKISMKELFYKKLNKGYSREELISVLGEVDKKDYSALGYDDIFFLVFLNYIEPHLPEGPVFIFDYPPELAALSRIEEGRARRFEIYWKGVELGNAFYELKDAKEQKNRFLEEKKKREELGKESFLPDQDLISALEKGIPDVSGIAIGLDRLFMIFLGHKDFRFISPYFEKKN